MFNFGQKFWTNFLDISEIAASLTQVQSSETKEEPAAGAGSIKKRMPQSNYWITS